MGGASGGERSAVLLRCFLQSQAHRGVLEDTQIHKLEVFRNVRREFHVREDVLFQINAGGDFREGQAFVGDAEHGALGDVESFLAGFTGVFTTESDLLYIVHKLFAGAVFDNVELAVFDFQLHLARDKGAAEAHFFCVLGDVDETARGPTTRPPNLDTLTLP